MTEASEPAVATWRVQTRENARLAYEVRGDGMPLLALHGAYSARGEVRGFLEPMLDGLPVRRVYVDLPGHGESRPSDGVDGAQGVLDLVDRLLQEEGIDGRFLLLGHSFGGLVARAVAARNPDRVAGLALLCPYLDGPQRPAQPSVVRDDGVSADLERAQRDAYEGYFVVRTAETLARFREAVAPASGEVDDAVFERALDALDADAGVIEAPVLVACGRQDGWVGWERQQDLGTVYPRATVVTVADAGHALPHERPALVAALLADWLAQAGV
ncbi:alpha/beta fold hydrolase [Microbacterium lushaniae]|uniref:Alpha/beta hydrolase n=1 Tax=Microbacterium lushaniae TaxID=2614639 RepID=A0A5J6L8E0_9MICO|nr:alpha/beta hydrolase [Microbacterium lushaniae]QEW04681.1 alpha/beta hydrolase [Microbacterium lushaniae]